MGVSNSDAIRPQLRCIDPEPRPPDAPTPGDETRGAIAELEAGQGEAFATVADLMADLRAD